MPGFEIFDETEKRHINDVMESGILMRYNFDSLRNGHWKAKELEEEIEKKFNIPHAHLLSSGTAAVMASLHALEIGAGDEVILPSFTFVASFEAIIFLGAIPVFGDVDDTLCLNPASVEKAITAKTKAIMPVHMCGAMADLDALLKIAKNHKLFLVEDACQAIGATYQGKYLGTLGDIGCYSFDFVKTITCGEGGAVVTKDKKLYERVHQFADHGHDHIGNDRGAEEHPILGLNFRISELNAAIGLGQWGKLDRIIDQQRHIKSLFKSILSKNDKIKFRRIPDEQGDNASFLSIFLESQEKAEKVAGGLKEAGVPSAYWYHNNWHYVKEWEHFKNASKDPIFSKELRQALPDYKNQDFSISDAIIEKTISFPLSLKMTDERIEEMARIVLKLVDMD